MNVSRKIIAEVINEASFPVLVASLTQITGDLDFLAQMPKPQTATLGETQGHLIEEQKAQIKIAALDILDNFFNTDKYEGASRIQDTDLHQIMNYVVGQEVDDEYVPMMLNEINGSSPVTAKLKQSGSCYSVLIVGAGMSGILAGIKMQEIGLDYKIYEKGQAVGGTWHDNTYPGCRVDIANHFYCYSFEQDHEWSEHFSQQPELQGYFDNIFKKYDLHAKTSFNTEVESMDYSEDGCLWTVTSANNGQTAVEQFDLVISCVGQLNQPKIPDINGLKEFKGKVFHSSQWPDDDCITNKRVAVIGSGASAFQIVPAIADQCQDLTIFQRSPPWMFPNPKYHEPVSKHKKWLLKNIPNYSRWYRFLLFWPGSDQLLDSLIVDPSWGDSERSINATNDAMRQLFTDAMLSQISDNSLIDKVVPTYPPFGKRMLQDNGAWLEALHKSHVHLHADAVTDITSTGIMSADGLCEFDTIVLATGFRAQEFFIPISINGKDGNFQDRYKDSPESYLGITFHDLPNFFAMYGPGTNLAHAGSIIFNAECQIEYICRAIQHLAKSNLKHLTVQKHIVKAHQALLEKRLDKTVWQHSKVSSWYQNSKGKVVTTSPWKLLEYWRWTHNFNGDDYEA